MQKKLFMLLGVLLLVIFFFIQNSGTKKVIKRDTPASVQKAEKVQSHITESVGDVLETPQASQIDKPFMPSIDLDPGNMPRSTAVEVDIKEIESKTERELQKEVFTDIELRMTTEMQTIPDCLENAQNKNEALNCSKKLQSINRDFELILGIERDDSIQNVTGGFVWNETTKDNMIKQLDAGIQSMQELFACIQASDTDEEQEKCFEVEQH